MDTSSKTAYPAAIATTSTESAAYALFAFAIAMTALGAYASVIAPLSFAGLLPVALILELVLIFTAPWWSRAQPLNYLLFPVFPFLSGFTLIPYLFAVLQVYENGMVLILNALSATACMALTGAVAVKLLRWDLSWMGRTLLFGLLGLICLGLLQLFIPSLRTTGMELAISGGGVLLFALFTAYDMQRIQEQGRMGANPFMLALSLYLDIYNLFLYALRFLTIVSGNRR